jgi:hypothetical protein
MASKPPSNPQAQAGTQFVVDLGEVELTDDEVSAVQNEITRIALDMARRKAEPAAKKKEPYVKILHVKTTHVRTVKK